MSEVAALIADMVRAGVDPDLIGRAAAALAQKDAKDPVAERRREIDRLRKRDNWQSLRLEVFARDEYVCVYCGTDVRDAPQCDHVFPISRGGRNEISNLATSCRSCNSQKGFKTPEEWQS